MSTGGANPWPSDGVVLHFRSFGTTGTVTAPFHLGRIAVHDIGHWLNLYHVWGDDGTACWGSDQCADTPNQGGPSTGTLHLQFVPDGRRATGAQVFELDVFIHVPY